MYADVAGAVEAIGDWRDETTLCGGPGLQSHSGEPVEWFVRAVSITGANEAWQAFELSQDLGGIDVSGHDPFLTLARVGNAVYVETFFSPGHLDRTSIAASSHAGSRSVASYVPTLAPFASSPR